MKPIVRGFTDVILLGFSLVMATIGTASAQTLIEYSSPAIRGKVLADETGRPLAGVHLVVFWEGNKAAPPMYPHTLKILETTSIADGTFVVPAWGPSLLLEPVSPDSPGLMAYRPGYEPKSVKLGASLRGEMVQEIRLRRFEKAPAGRAQALAEVAGKLAYLMAPLSTQPKPRMLAAVEAEWRGLPEDAIPEEASAEGVSLNTLYDWWLEEFRRAQEYRDLEK